MTIAKPRFKNAESSFIVGAPDAKPVRWQRGNKTQITLSISPELLEQVDAVAHRRHLSRAALLTVWINDRLEQERP